MNKESSDKIPSLNIFRIRLFEFEDLSWFPSVIRKGGTDYLKYFLIYSRYYQPCIGLLSETFQNSGQKRIIDLCSGSGGVIEQVAKELSQGRSSGIEVVLTDKYPNLDVYAIIAHKSKGNITYRSDAVDLKDLPEDLDGFRVIFSAIHHFEPLEVRSLLENCLKQGAPIAIFDGGDSKLKGILGVLLVHPITFLLFTPFFKPFLWSRFLFTYLIPIIPLYTIWDGIVSILRMYSIKDYETIISSLSENDFQWKVGTLKNKLGLTSTYLIGTPAQVYNPLSK